MSRILRNIAASVGIRNCQTQMPNNPKDLSTIMELFDRIPVAQGGSAEIGGVWATERNAIIDEVTAQIIKFQTVNARPVVDGVLDPAGGTLKLMNQVASDPPAGAVAARVAPPPDGFREDEAYGIYVVDVNLMDGFRPIQPLVVGADYVRKLVRVEGSSITWYGVVIPRACTGQGSIPHINFTPTPDQGGYRDGTYDSFGGWGRLWADYTSVIGGQVAASGVNQILVIPFYKNSQQQNLGDFLFNWKEVVGAVITEALISFNPFLLRTDFTFDEIVSSSFSNGFVAHQNFNTKADRAAAMTDYIFDLDGQAGGSHWTPKNGVIYRNKTTKGKINPEGGNIWYVGERWGDKFSPIYPSGINTHAASRNHLLYHGLFKFCW
ncbi:MAG: hypothetical protein DMG79_00335 [Acidobacteria bacterium]|nr:MAG: hypothetical protein DMG79_00335 [Acidobacteriota bacterium]